jgi:hypothetical protein
MMTCTNAQRVPSLALALALLVGSFASIAACTTDAGATRQDDGESSDDDGAQSGDDDTTNANRDASVTASVARDASPAHEKADASQTPVALASERCTGDIPFPTPSFEVFEDETSFQEAYSNATHDAAPVVDFDTHVVLAVFAGFQVNCGTQVRIAELTEREDAVEVQVVLSRPGNCFVEQSLSYPYAFALAERSSLPFEFVQTETTRVCDDP